MAFDLWGLNWRLIVGRSLLVIALGIILLVISSSVFVFVGSNEPCGELRLYCDLARLQEDATVIRRCEIVGYCTKPVRSGIACQSLLRALQKVEANVRPVGRAEVDDG